MSEKDVYELTNPQKSIWLTEEYYKGTNINNVCGTARIYEKLDFDILKESINTLVKNNSSFLINFKFVDGKLKQYKTDFKPFDIEVIEVNTDEDIKKIETNLMSRIFNIEDSYLFEFKIFKFPDSTGGFIPNIHHLLCDSWTLGLVCKEVINVYNALISKTEIEFPTSDYFDFCLNEQLYLNSQKFEKDKQYWNALFETIPEVASIPSKNNQHQKIISCKANRISYGLKKETVKKINSFCKNNNISIFNFLTTIYSLYIGRVCNLNDFVIGTPILNRSNFTEKNTTGMFVSTLPLRIHIGNEKTFIDLVKNVAQNSMGLLRHQKYPYEFLLKDLREKEPNLPNLYNVLVSYQITKTTTSELNHTSYWSFNGNCADELQIHILDLNDTGELNISYDYKIQKFDVDEIEAIHKRIEFIINQVLENNEILLNDIEIVTDKEKDEILNKFNDTYLDYDKNKTIVDFFEEQVKKTPDNIALVFEGKELTYKELNEKSNQLANCLRKQRIKNNDIVGIMTNRSFEMIVGILSILKAGGAYLPIDPDYPVNRISYVLKNSKCSILLSQNSLDEKIKNIDFNGKKILIDFTNIDIYSYSTENPVNITKPDDLSYVIYTSGSTGNPKGVMLTHKNYSNFYNSMINKIYYLKDNKQHSIISITTLSFDIFAFETIISLSRGLKLFITNNSEQKMTSKIEKLLLDNNIEIIQTTPSIMNFHLDNASNNGFSKLKYIMLAGEQLPTQLIDKIHKVIPNSIIYNGYGPSETTIFSAIKNVTSVDTITIGNPIHNTQIYILDNNLNILPKGIIGEIYISGDGVGRGYLNNAILTEERYIINPFEKNSVMYKTGDVGCWLENGEILCKGRIDNQVKLRGLRVELEEIENKINNFDSTANIKSAVVVKKYNNKDILCAFISASKKIDNNELQKYLLNYLPTYMIPNSYVFLDNLPLTPNGKIDKKSLKTFELEDNNSIVEIEKPTTQTEILIYNYITKLLNNNNFGISNSFFNIGLDSLGIINLASKLSKDFKNEITISDIYEANTIKQLALLIDTQNYKNTYKKLEKTGEKKLYNVSSSQKRIFFLSKMSGDNSCLYNMPGAIIFDKLPNVDRLDECLKKLINRHDSLRTCFEIVDNNVYQKIINNIKFELETEASNNENIDEVFGNFVKPFDLTKAPLFRAKLVHLKNKAVLLFDMHHIISDGLSLTIMTKELSDLYNGNELRPLSYSYVDYSEWEFNQINSTEFNNNKKYWINQFKNEIPILNMPTDYPRPASQSFEGNKINKIISKKLVDKINKLCKSLNVSNNMFLLSCYYILLSKYTEQEDIVVGFPVVGREIFELSNNIGMFTNTLALKNHINFDMTFKEFLYVIKNSSIDAIQHQNYPFDELVKNLHITRDASRNPLFDTMFIYQNNGYPEINFDGIMSSELYIPDIHVSKFDLSLEVIPHDNNIQLNFEYATSLFKKDTITRLAEHFLNILEYVSNNIDKKIQDIQMISDVEKSTILTNFNNNNNKSDYPYNKTIIKLFEEQAEKNPNNKAIIFNNTFITYKDLNEKANLLALKLIDSGITNKDIVSINVNRSIDLITAILSVMKTGAAYVLIDSSFPKERIDYIISDSKSKLYITKNQVDFDLEIINNNSINKENALSIIYTSGSTGNPKGVLLHNNGFVNLMFAFDKEMQISRYKNILGIASVSFDMFSVELFSTIVFGNTLVLANEEQQKDPFAISELINNNNVEFLITTPSKIELLLLEELNNPLKNVKAFQLGGEKLTSSLYNKLKKVTNAKIFNGYGPTEITACCTNKLVDSDDVTIGNPISNMQIYICDKNLDLLPIGITGEICVAGVGIANGYLNNPEATSKSFVKNPYGDGYLYKTGDLGKYRANGEIEYIGRSDFQVKLRGLRIELGEIETKICEIPSINNCVIIKKDDKLCAYFTASKKIDVSFIRNRLKNSLPMYMVPNYIIQIDKMPYNNNGKIDVKELSKLEISDTDKQIVLPQNEIESKLVEILKLLLNNNNISMNDYFFEIGGDSLSAINLCVKIQSVFNKKIEVKDIMNNITVKDIANIIMKNNNKVETSLIRKVEKSDFYPVSSAQKRIFFASKVSGDSSILYNSPSAVIMEGNVDVKKLETCINKIINRHESLKTYFELNNETVVQKVEDYVDYKLEVLNQIEFNNFDIKFKEFIKPFDLSIAPLFRARFINFTNGKSALFLDMHHIIFDGTSMSIFIDELCKLYNGEGLPELKISYKDYSNFESERIKNGNLEEAKNYWLNQFKDELPILNMPSTYPRPAIQSFEGKKVYSTIDINTTKRIEQLAKKLEVTPYMLLLSIYYILLSKYTGQSDIVVGSPVVGRDIPETLNLIGMFVNTLALREKIDNNQTFNHFVLQIKEHLLKAFEYQSYPFDELVNKLQIKRDTSRNPLFDTMFIYQSNNYTNVNLKDIKTKYFIPDTNISKFDISLEIIPNYEKMNLSIEYSTKLFSKEFAENLLNHFINILDNVLANNEILISNINMLSKEETKKILYDFNNTKTDYDKNINIINLFEEQVKKTPNNIAVVFGEESLTYEQLNNKANSLAYYLKNNINILKNDIIGIMTNRSLETMIAIIGVLKAGGSYIPIDPTFPKERINYMLESSHAKILLTQKHLREKINFSKILCVDLSENNIYKNPCDNLENISEPNDLMYIIFTSGSTGKPKGVMVTHKVFSNFTNYCNNYVEYLKNPQYETIVSITTISFDIFAYETLISLQKGLKVVIANENEQVTPHLLNNLMEKNNVKIIQSTPSVMQIFLNNLENMPALKKLNYAIFAGEQLPLNIVQTLKSLSNIIIYNGYGPSETYYCTLTKIDNDFITIGKPIDNSQMYILDENLKPVPIGVTGEIYISGDCVGKGYLNNEELTKKSFIPNPFIENSIMYKSGDLGKYLNDGNIICLGRSDHQIKIRGQRIEAEEIEKLINNYPNINKVTVVKQSLQNREFISAYLTVTKRISVGELRKYLSHLLPRYMVPSYFIVLDEFPYTPNGKIDKKALPLPTELLNTKSEKYAPPKTQIEKHLVSIWEKVLNTSPIGINDNFFELGGDSILAMNLNLELQKKYTNITYSDIFRFPTITELEEKINSNNNKQFLSKIENLSDNYVDILKKCTKPCKIKHLNPGNVLLTGATGFLGIHILEEFIKKSDVKIYCIIRDEPGLTARTKIHQKLNYYFGNKYDRLIDERIIPITGNITQPGFGLNQEDLLTLANSVDIVINCAARVSHFGNYDDFYNSNVKSVKYIIDFCSSFNKKLYHISTLGVSGKKLNNSLIKYTKRKKSKNKIIFDESCLYIGQKLDNVYTYSKFEAESYVLEAISKGLDGYIIRMGNLMSRSRDGVFQENILENAFVNDLAAFIKLGAIPDTLLKQPLEFTPVDITAKATYLLITNPSNHNRIFHLYNKNTVFVTKYLKILNKLGYNINILTEENFKNKIKDYLNSEMDKNSIGNLLNYSNKDLTFDYKSNIEIKSQFTVKYLKKLNFRWCRITNKYLINFIKILRKVM